MKKILKYVPILGFAVGSIFSMRYLLISLIVRGIPDSVTLVANLLMLVLVFVMLFITYGLIKFEDRVFKLAIIISFLSFVSLFSSPDFIELVTVFSGIVLLINKKLLHI